MGGTISYMETVTTKRERGRRRRARLDRVAEVRRLAVLPPGGRAWINGREVGGVDPRFDHLTRSYD